jgi:site-specific DNA recombinase
MTALPAFQKTIDVYARVSRATDRRMRSTKGQASECQAWLPAHNYAVGITRSDEGKSAWNERVVRPGWEEIMARMERGDSDGVMVYELTRFARRSTDGHRLLAVAKKGAVIIDSDGLIDLTTGQGRKIFRDAISAAEADSDKISERTKRGKRAKARDEKEPNSSTRAFGFMPGNIVENKVEADELRAAARKLVGNPPVDQVEICADLNRRGVLTALGNPWKPPSLRVALLRPGNVGDVGYWEEVEQEDGTKVREYRITRTGRTGILDRATYDKVCAVYAGRRRGRPVTNLATGFVKCERCGRGMHAKEQSPLCTPYADGTRAKAYLCIKRDGGCGSRIDYQDLNTFLRDLALRVLSAPASASGIEAAARAADTELTVVTTEIEELETLADGLAAKLGSGELKQRRYDAAVEGLDKRIAVLEARRATLTASAPVRAVNAEVRSRASWERRWRDADLAGQRDILATAFQNRKVQVLAGGRFDPADERCSLV